MEGVPRASGSSAWAASASASAAAAVAAFVVVYSAVSTAVAEAAVTLPGIVPRDHGEVGDYTTDFIHIDDLPPVRPPHGIVPELQNPPGAAKGPNYAGLAVCLSVATILFAVRSFVKWKIRRNYLVEDVTCTIAWMILVIYCACVFAMISSDTGYNDWSISREDYARLLRWLYINSLVYCPAAFFTKVTLLLLIARVFNVKTGVAHAIHAFIVVLACAYIPLQVVQIIICQPIHAYWNPSVSGRCFDQRRVFLADLGVALTTDLVILVVPIPLTWRMRASWQKKLKIVFMLGAGGSALGVVIYRLYLVVRATGSHGDAQSHVIMLDLLQIVECTIGLSCSCLPALNILIAHYSSGRKWIISPRQGSGTTNPSGTSASSENQNQNEQSRGWFARHPNINRFKRGVSLRRIHPASHGSSPLDGTTLTATTDNTTLKHSSTTGGGGGSTTSPAPGCLERLWEDTAFPVDEADEDMDDLAERREKRRRRERGRRVDFDPDMGGTSPSGRHYNSAFWGIHNRDSWLRVGPYSLFGLERVTSEDGRRDGWLANGSTSNANGSSSRKTEAEEEHSSRRRHSETEHQQQQQQQQKQQQQQQTEHSESRLAAGERQGMERRPSSIRNVGDIEIEMARVTGNKPWERIFDGRDND